MSGLQQPESGSSMALTAPGDQRAVFNQQGTVDWARVAQMTFSAPVAILGRLASAGIDPLTVAFGQAMGSVIPIGAHGERLLHESLGKLTAFSSFGDLIWFGIGVQHISRELVKTSQGAALVALCAALAEGYTHDVSALILYELSKMLDAPADLTPSFSQWMALVKSSASIFVDSTFGVRIAQLCSMSGFPKLRQLDPGHPTDLAEAILSLGKIVRGELEAVTLSGSANCSWIAVWAEHILGLRVLVCNHENSPIHCNYDETKQRPQVTICFMESNNNSDERGLYQISHTLAVRSGLDFIAQHLSHDTPDPRDACFSGGRVEWDGLFEAAFDFKKLLHEHTLDQKPNGISLGTAMSRLLVIGSFVIAHEGGLPPRFSSFHDFWIWGLCKLSELHPWSNDILKTATDLDQQSNRPISPADSYMAAIVQAYQFCLCYKCCIELSGSKTPVSGDFRDTSRCLLEIVESMLVFLMLISNVVLETPLKPCRRSIAQLHTDFPRGLKIRSDRFVLLDPTAESLLSSDMLSAERVVNLFYCCGSRGLFTTTGNSHKDCAVSSGSIYAYVETVKHVTTDFASCLNIRVGVGAIQLQSRTYDSISDPTGRYVLSYKARPSRLALDASSLTKDTSTPGLALKAMAEVRADRLTFWYEISAGPRTAKIAASALRYRLAHSCAYLCLRPGILLDHSKKAALKDIHRVIEGEGAPPSELSPGHVLRPLRGNDLARCITLIQTYPPMRNVLVKNEEQLQLFIRYWNWNFSRALDSIDQGSTGDLGNKDDSHNSVDDEYSVFDKDEVERKFFFIIS